MIRIIQLYKSWKLKRQYKKKCMQLAKSYEEIYDKMLEAKQRWLEHDRKQQKALALEWRGKYKILRWIFNKED